MKAAGECEEKSSFGIQPGADSSVVRTSPGVSAIPACSVPALVASETSPTGSVENKPPAGVDTTASSPPEPGEQPNPDAGVNESSDEACIGRLSPPPSSPRTVPSSLGVIELDLHGTALITVPPPVEDELFDNLSGSAVCEPSLEYGIAPRVIALAIRCAMHGRKRSAVRDPMLTKVSIEAGEADAYRHSIWRRSMMCYLPVLCISRLTADAQNHAGMLASQYSLSFSGGVTILVHAVSASRKISRHFHCFAEER